MGLLTRQFVERSKEIRELKKEKAYRDGDGLYLLARPNGTHSWFYRYSHNGIRDKITIGKYKDIPITEARYKVLEYNQLLAKSFNPKIEKVKQQLHDESLFINIANKFFESKHSTFGSDPWKSIDTYNQNFRLLSDFILPKLRNRNIREIETWELAKLFEKQSPHTQRKMKTLLLGIFSLAIGKGYAKYNIVRDIVTDKAYIEGFKFIDPIDDQATFNKLVNDIDNYSGQLITKFALQLSVLLGLRPSNLTELKWHQVNEDDRYIVISAGEMKKSRQFRQPLSDQAFNILMKLKNITGHKMYVFSSICKKQHLNKDSLSKALRSMGYQNKQCTHGFRKSVRTYISSIRNNYNWCDDSVRMILSHKKSDKMDDTYDKNDFLVERREMLQIWSDYVDHVRKHKNVIRMEDFA